MGQTEALAYISKHLTGNINPIVGIRNQIVRSNRAFKRDLAATFTPPTLPAAPNVMTETTQAAQQAAQAAALQRRRATNGTGYGSTILTSPSGAPPAVTARKTLLGQ